MFWLDVSESNPTYANMFSSHKVWVEEAAAKLRNGNPAMVVTSNAEYGDECWAALDGRAVAVGIYKAGELHPNRVFAAPVLSPAPSAEDP